MNRKVTIISTWEGLCNTKHPDEPILSSVGRLQTQGGSGNAVTDMPFAVLLHARLAGTARCHSPAALVAQDWELKSPHPAASPACMQNGQHQVRLLSAKQSDSLRIIASNSGVKKLYFKALDFMCLAQAQLRFTAEHACKDRQRGAQCF